MISKNNKSIHTLRYLEGMSVEQGHIYGAHMTGEPGGEDIYRCFACEDISLLLKLLDAGR